MLIAPLIPGVNDAPGQIEELAELVGEAGAESIAGIGMHLRGEVRDIWFDWLRQYRPDLVPRYEELYRKGAYMPTRTSARSSPSAPAATPDGGRAADDGPPRRGSGPSRASCQRGEGANSRGCSER